MEPDVEPSTIARATKNQFQNAQLILQNKRSFLHQRHHHRLNNKNHNNSSRQLIRHHHPSHRQMGGSSRTSSIGRMAARLAREERARHKDVLVFAREIGKPAAGPATDMDRNTTAPFALPIMSISTGQMQRIRQCAIIPAILASDLGFDRTFPVCLIMGTQERTFASVI